MPKQQVVAEQLGDKVAVWRGNENFGTTYPNSCEYDEKLDENDEKLEEYEKNALDIAEQSGNTREVATGHETTRNRYWRNGQYEKTVDWFEDKREEAKVELAEESGDKEQIARTHCNIAFVYNSTVQHIKALESYRKTLNTAEAWEDKEIRGLIFNNIGLEYESIGQFREAIDFYLSALKIFKDVEDKQGLAKTQLCLENLYAKIDRQSEPIEYFNIAQELAIGKCHETMDNVYILNIGDQSKKTISCHYKHREFAEGFGDKQDANGITGATGYRRKQSELGVRGKLGNTRKRREHLNCKCVFILSNTDSIPSQIIERFQEALHDRETTRAGSVVLRFTTPVIKVVYQTFLDVTAINVDGNAAKNDVVCHCKSIFATIDGILFGEGLCSHSVKTCQEDSVMHRSGATQGSPTDAELFITEVELLTTEMCLVKSATERISSECHLSETRCKESAEMKSKYQGILRQFRFLGKERSVHKNAPVFQGREMKSIPSDSAAVETSPQDVYSQDVDMINETPEMNCGVQKLHERTTTILEDNHYPVPMLFGYFASSLHEQDWDELRRVMQYHIPENVLRNLPNGIGVFEELVDRDFVSNRDMKLLREVFNQIQRIDCVHLIDRSKESDCSLLVENAQAVNIVVGQKNGSSFAAGQEIRRIPVQGYVRQPEGGASGFSQIPTNVHIKDGNERWAQTDVGKRLAVREEYIGTGGQEQGGEMAHKYNNSPLTSQTSHVDVLTSDIERNCQIRNDGTTTGHSTTMIRCARPCQSEEETGHDDEISNDEVTQHQNGERCESRCCKTGNCVAEHDKTGNYATGSCKTGCCDGENNHDARRNGSLRQRDQSGGERKANWNKNIQFPCKHYERYCDVQFGCCEEFWPCHRCHNSESQCDMKKLLSQDVTKIRCKRCSRVQEFPKETPSCVECGLKFAEYFCAICQHLTGRRNKPYHCEACGICRVKEDSSFHCDICGVCMDVKLLENHTCRPDSAHDECCICLEDAFNGCHILPCTHKIHVNCVKLMLQNGVKSCPVCRKPFPANWKRTN